MAIPWVVSIINPPEQLFRRFILYIGPQHHPSHGIAQQDIRFGIVKVIAKVGPLHDLVQIAGYRNPVTEAVTHTRPQRTVLQKRIHSPVAIPVHVMPISQIQLHFVLNEGQRFSPKVKTIPKIVRNGRKAGRIGRKDALTERKRAIDVVLVLIELEILLSVPNTMRHPVGGQDLLFGRPRMERIQPAHEKALPEKYTIIPPGVPRPLIARATEACRLGIARATVGVTE